MKNENSRAFRLGKARAYDGLSLRYVGERDSEGEEALLGRGGCLSLRNGEFIVLCGQETVFRAPAQDISYSELLSGNGVILSGVDTDTGKERTLVAYFTYYRK